MNIEAFLDSLLQKSRLCAHPCVRVCVCVLVSVLTRANTWPEAGALVSLQGSYEYDTLH